MTLLANYLMRAILTSVLLVMLVLLALAGLIEFIGQLDTTQGGYQIPQALLFAVLRLPQLSFEMLPIAALIGALLGLGGLANNSELVVMRTAGLSVMKLGGMVALSGVVLMFVMGLVGEYIGPPLDYFARTMRDEARYEQENRDFGNAAWVKDGSVILHLEKIYMMVVGQQRTNYRPISTDWRSTTSGRKFNSQCPPAFLPNLPCHS